MTEPEVDFVPPSSYFVSQRGWGRRFSTRQAALEYVDFLVADGGL